MQRISIVGSGGAGKSTLARALGKALGLEVVHLDLLFWPEGRSDVSRAEQAAILAKVFQNDGYVVEGCYRWTYPDRLADCDTLIWMDLPPHWRFVNILRRVWSKAPIVGQPLRSAATGGPWRMTPSRVFLAQYRDMCALEPVFARPPSGVRMIRLQSFAAAQAFLDGLQK